MWHWLAVDNAVRTVIDVGCGDGTGALTFFRDHGCKVLGIDGIPQPDPDIVEHDFTTGPFPHLPLAHRGDFVTGDVDLVWCCEFVEHVEARYVPNFLPTLKRARMLLMTHAEPGQTGWHHVNCQSADYWRGALAAVGYQLDEQLTAQARALASINTSPYNHFRRSGMAFTRG
jgi:hypothetical protein